jgi:hypothetical protein
VDVEEYAFVQHRHAILEGIARGERALAQGQVLSHAQAQEKMAQWLNNLDTLRPIRVRCQIAEPELVVVTT